MKKSILFVDDDEDILYCYRMMTESENVIVYTANDANAALDIIRETKIDIVVLDYMLPELNGDLLAKKINKIDPGIKIFFVSGYDIALEAIKRLDIAVYGVFMKPVEPGLLKKIVNTDEYASTDYQAVSIYYGNQYSNIQII